MSHTIKVILSQANNSTSYVHVINPVSEWAKEQVKDAVIGGLQAVGEILVDLSYSLALVGSGICLLFWVSGWKNGGRWIGVLLLAHVLIRYLLGG